MKYEENELAVAVVAGSGIEFGATEVEVDTGVNLLGLAGSEESFAVDEVVAGVSSVCCCWVYELATVVGCSRRDSCCFDAVSLGEDDLGCVYGSAVMEALLILIDNRGYFVR